jgi:hypothetical protein
MATIQDRLDDALIELMMGNIFVWRDKVKELNKLRALATPDTNVVELNGGDNRANIRPKN